MSETGQEILGWVVVGAFVGVGGVIWAVAENLFTRRVRRTPDPLAGTVEMLRERQDEDMTAAFAAELEKAWREGQGR